MGKINLKIILVLIIATWTAGQGLDLAANQKHCDAIEQHENASRAELNCTNVPLPMTIRFRIIIDNETQSKDMVFDGHPLNTEAKTKGSEKDTDTKTVLDQYSSSKIPLSTPTEFKNETTPMEHSNKAELIGPAPYRASVDIWDRNNDYVIRVKRQNEKSNKIELKSIDKPSESMTTSNSTQKNLLVTDSSVSRDNLNLTVPVTHGSNHHNLKKVSASGKRHRRDTKRQIEKQKGLKIIGEDDFLDNFAVLSVTEVTPNVAHAKQMVKQRHAKKHKARGHKKYHNKVRYSTPVPLNYNNTPAHHGTDRHAVKKVSNSNKRRRRNFNVKTKVRSGLENHGVDQKRTNSTEVTTSVAGATFQKILGGHIENNHNASKHKDGTHNADHKHGSHNTSATHGPHRHAIKKVSVSNKRGRRSSNKEIEVIDDAMTSSGPSTLLSGSEITPHESRFISKAQKGHASKHEENTVFHPKSGKILTRSTSASHQHTFKKVSVSGKRSSRDTNVQTDKPSGREHHGIFNSWITFGDALTALVTESTSKHKYEDGIHFHGPKQVSGLVAEKKTETIKSIGSDTRSLAPQPSKARGRRNDDAHRLEHHRSLKSTGSTRYPKAALNTSAKRNARQSMKQSQGIRHAVKSSLPLRAMEL